MAEEKTTAHDPWHDASIKLNEMAAKYATMLTGQSFYSAFSRASISMMNQPQIQNRRIKGISSLPCDYTKEDIGEFTRKPYESETPLRQTSEVLKWTNYPYFKLNKTYQDIGTYHFYAKPLYIDEAKAKSDDFKRDAVLIDKLNRTFDPSSMAHEATGKALSLGKAVFYPRYKVDKIHNKVLYAFWQQLPADWCTIIGKNNISGYTISFNMMYFLQQGTDISSFGDGEDNLFAPFIDDFESMFIEPKSRSYSPSVKYNSAVRIDCKGQKINFYPEKFNADGAGNPKMFMQDGRWAYWVSLPVEKVWVYEIDDTTPAAASPFSGMFITYSQQADYEAAQLSLLLNPLIKIFTGEVDTFNDSASTEKDVLKVSQGLQMYYTALFNQLMESNNTGGTAIFAAPYKNIKSHDFAESANANDISSEFSKYAGGKAGMNALIPVTDDIKASQVEASKAIEARFATVCVYSQFSKMMNYIYSSLNLRTTFQFVMFGDIFHDDKTRENAQKSLDKGDISAYFTLCALDGQSWLEKMSMMNVIGSSGITERLQVPPTAYTQTGDSDINGRPKSEDTSDSKEKSIDMGVVDAE